MTILGSDTSDEGIRGEMGQRHVSWLEGDVLTELKLSRFLYTIVNRGILGVQ